MKKVIVTFLITVSLPATSLEVVYDLYEDLDIFHTPNEIVVYDLTRPRSCDCYDVEDAE